MQTTFDRTQEDLGNSVGLEHLNLTIPDQQTRHRVLHQRARAHARSLSRYRSREHVGERRPQPVSPADQGRAGGPRPRRARDAGPRGPAAAPRNGEGSFVEHEVRLFQAQRPRRSDLPLGQHVSHPRSRIARSSARWFSAWRISRSTCRKARPQGSRSSTARSSGRLPEVEKGRNGASANVHVGMNQHLIFNETSATLPPYDGHHLQLYVVNFSGPAPAIERTRPDHRGKQPGPVSLREDRRSRRAGSSVYEFEHEIRSITHPLLCAPDDQSQPGAVESGLQAWTRRHLVGDGLRGMTRRPRALVIGGSLGGLFAANVLREVCAWDVEVFERVENDLAARGAGIATHDEMFDVLRRVGLAVDESFGIDVSRRVCFGKSGEIVYELPMLRKMSAWARFYRPLKDLFPADAVSLRHGVRARGAARGSCGRDFHGRDARRGRSRDRR